MMKNRPLVFQIWVFMAGVATFFGLVLMLVLPQLLGSFFTDEIFSTIESAQNERFAILPEQLRDQMIADELGLGEALPQVRMPNEEGDIRAVSHVIIQENGLVKSLFPLSAELQDMMIAGIERFVADDVSRFSYPYQEKTLYFSIMYGQPQGVGLYLVSYMTNDYRDQLIASLLQRISWLIAGALVAAWIPAFFIARYLTKPLVTLQTHVLAYARRSLDHPVRVDRRDEIGRLAQSIEQMRVQLLQHDETQQSVLQNISHELKTPVMVIQGYVQSMQDGMLTEAQLPGSLAAIERETKRLEKRISDLLYMTKLDYLAKHHVEFVEVRLHELVEAVAERMRWLKPDLQWTFDLKETVVQADVEQWQVVFENILDNQIRYAAQAIQVELQPQGENETVLRFWNDGPPLKDGDEEHMFTAFRKGEDGKFGLGLVIVKRIADLHQVQVTASNQEGGVAFEFRFAHASRN